MAPEIIEMSAPPSAACDIWSLGCTILELTTGKPPHFDLSPMAALFRIVQDDIPRAPARASEALRDFLLQCFNREAGLRADARSLVSHAWLQRAPAQSPSARSIYAIKVTKLDHGNVTSEKSTVILQSAIRQTSCHTPPKSELCKVIALNKYRETEEDDMQDGFAICEDREKTNLYLKDARKQTSGCPAFSKVDISDVNWDTDQHDYDLEIESSTSSGLSVYEKFNDHKLSVPGLFDNNRGFIHDGVRERKTRKREEIDILLFHLTMMEPAKNHDKSISVDLIKLLESGDSEANFLSEVGAISLVEALRSPACAKEALQAARILLVASSNAADVLVEMGVAPLLLPLTSNRSSLLVELLGVVLNLFRLRCSEPCLRVFLFGGGVQLAVELLLKPDESTSLGHHTATLAGVEFLLHVLSVKFKSSSLTSSRTALCRALALRDAPARLAASLESCLAANDSVDRSAAIKIACTLAALCDSDSVVKESVAASSTSSTLLRVLVAFPARLASAWKQGIDGETEAWLTVKLLGALKAVTMTSAAALDSLAMCGAIEITVTILQVVQTGLSDSLERKMVPRRDELEDQLLPIVYYLCRIDRSRLARAARCGTAILLAACVARRRHLKQFALAILCDLCHAAANDAHGGIGPELWRAGGVRLYVRLLVEVYWGVRALSALNAWLKADRRVEAAMVDAGCPVSIVCLFAKLDTTEFEQSLAPLLDACETSPIFARALLKVCIGPRKHVFMLELVHKLERHAAAFVRKMLLEILRAILAASEAPRCLFLATHLDTVLVALLTDGMTSDQVLVFDLARTILSQAAQYS
mmetsp:Transcript_30539/g.94464  ORF Transcript_30539/g.94464 Transcript_30539/m.94464 type:complete len:818 (-) Transcript_30539:77-2530(-)